MLVDLVLMRHLGKKLSHEAVRAATPLRGEITVARSVEGIFASFMGAAPAFALHYLRDARIISMHGSQFVLIGWETDHRSKWYALEYLQQAWWCRIIPTSAPSPQPEPSCVPNSPQVAAMTTAVSAK